MTSMAAFLLVSLDESNFPTTHVVYVSYSMNKSTLTTFSEQLFVLGTLVIDKW